MIYRTRGVLPNDILGDFFICASSGILFIYPFSLSFLKYEPGPTRDVVEAWVIKGSWSFTCNRGLREYLGAIGTSGFMVGSKVGPGKILSTLSFGN